MVRLLLGLLLLTLAPSAQAAVLMECIASAGFSYFIEGGALPLDPTKGEWEPDGINPGGISLIQDGDNFDIIQSDATGSTFSAKGDGANVVALSQSQTWWLILVLYPGEAMETYQFDKRSHGGEVVWTQHKFGDMVKKVGAFKASCGK